MKKNKLDILFDDESIVVVSKPAGLLSVPDRYDADIINLKHLLRDAYGEIYPVHRLDRGTSGVICFAKDQDTQRLLSKQFEERTVHKTYHTIVVGTPPAASGEIDMPIAPHPFTKGRMMANKGGKASHSSFRVLEQFRGHSYVEVQIHTGRTHQIRVHLNAIGCPVLGDDLYGKKGEFYLSELKRKYTKSKAKEERPLLTRPALHAFELKLNLPNTEDQQVITAPLPKDMRAVLNQMRKL